MSDPDTGIFHDIDMRLQIAVEGEVVEDGTLLRVEGGRLVPDDTLQQIADAWVRYRKVPHTMPGTASKFRAGAFGLLDTLVERGNYGQHFECMVRDDSLQQIADAWNRLTPGERAQLAMVHPRFVEAVANAVTE